MFSFWQRSDEPPHETVLRAFKIDAADLETNRNGSLTERQISLLRERNLWEIVANIASISAIGLVIRWITVYQHNPIPGFMSVIGAVVLALGILYFFKDQWDLVRDWQEGAVTSVSGPIHRHASRSLSIFVPSSRQSFAVSRRVYSVFRSGQTYILYYTPRSKRLVAAAHIPTNAIGK